MSHKLSPIDISSLVGKSILITGAASGLGLATARSFAAVGAFVTIADAQPGQHIAEELTSRGLHVQYVHCDVASWTSQVGAFKSAISFSQAKSLDVVVAFAGIDKQGSLVDAVKIAAATAASSSSSAGNEDDPILPSVSELDINLTGTYYTTALALHYFHVLEAVNPSSDVTSPPSSATTNSKSLTLVSSLAGYVDDTHNTSYTTSKFGLRGLFRAVRGAALTDLRVPVRVNLVAPWAIRTPMTEGNLRLMEEKLGIRTVEERRPEGGKGSGIEDRTGGVIDDHGKKRGGGGEEEKVMTLASIKDLVDCVGRLSCDVELSGRAIAIMPEGAFDLGDDIEGGYGGDELRTLMKWRREAGDFLTS